MSSGIKERSGAHFDLRLLNSLGVSIDNLVTDSRVVKPGDTFLAYVGEKFDARKFIPQAIEAGANAVLWERYGFVWDPEWQAPNLSISKLRTKAGAIASYVYGDPSQKLWLIGVTGTNGKTSCCQWIAQAMTALGKKIAVIGTLGDSFSGELQPATNTTPDPVLLQQRMADFLKRGAEYVVMEVSSHGTEQGRVNGSTFAVALFTNLSHDHLDYHGSMKSYAASKARLFQWTGLKYAVLNFDDAFGVELLGQVSGKITQVIGYGFNESEIRNLDLKKIKVVYGRNLKASIQGLEFDVEFESKRAKFKTELLGEFNASNLLAVLATLLASGFNLADAVQSLQQVQSVVGRMEKLGGGNLPLVVVDFAHTPDALEKILIALRGILLSSKATSKLKTLNPRLICVFGCGGDRDRSKRALMGKVATQLSDEVIITSDNPRSEDPDTIINEIVSGANSNHHIEENRAAAIYQAVSGARKGDVVLIAGKGHEVYQEIGGQRFPFSDVKVAQQILRNLMARAQV